MVITDWPLVGRTVQLGQVSALLQAGHLQGSLVLAGPPGTGKTRLATEILSLVARAGWATAQVTASKAAAELPLGAFAPLLPLTGRTAMGGPFELLQRSTRALAELAAGRPLALMVDDAQLLDSASATLTHQLASSRTAFVVATVRSGEPAPDPVVALWKDGLAIRVDVPPLEEDEIEALLSAALGGHPDTPTLRHLSLRSEGNPLFLRELVLGALDAGALRQDGGIWRLSGPMRASSRLVELVEARLAGISDAERAALEAVAYGEPLGHRLLGDLADRPALEALERRDLVAVTQTARRLEVRLAHPLYGDVLRQRIGVLRAGTLRTALADAVEATGARRREDVLRIATWRLDSGGPLRAELMLTAAERARSLCDFGLAIRLATAAIGAGGGFEPTMALAELLNLTGRCEEAERELAILAGRASTDAERGRVAVIRCDNWWYGLERPDEALQVAETAEASIVDQGWRDEVAGRRISVLRATGDTTAALRLAEELLARAEGRALVFICPRAAVMYAVAGRLERSLQVAERGHDVHLALKGPPLAWDPSTHVWSRCHALSWSGRLAEAEAEARREYESALADGSAMTKAYLLWELARITRLQGRVATAERLAREAVGIIREAGWPKYLVPVCLAELAHVLALAGRGREAAHVLQEVATSDRFASPFWGTIAEARAWTAAATGDLAGARSALEEMAAQAAGRGERVLEASALHDLVRLGVARSTDRMKALTRVTDSPLLSLQADHATAWSTSNAAGLMTVSRAFGDMGASLLAAEAAVQAATVLRRAGDGRGAAASEHRATRLGEMCEGAVTPALVFTGPARSSLTSREQEVAALAGAGMSNRAIADRLSLSVRTVENQLQRVYEKLGVSGRGELAAALGDL